MDVSDSVRDSEVRDPLDQENLLCDPCSLIDFSSASTEQCESREGYLFANLGDRLQSAPSRTCSLCRLFHHVRLPSPAWQYSLWGYSSLSCAHARLLSNPREYTKDYNSVFFVVLPDSDHSEKPDFAVVKRHCWSVGYISQAAQPRLEKFGGRIVPLTVDYSLIQSWLTWCQENYSKNCGFSAKSDQKFLKLIDCETLMIEFVPADSSYVALSYVWGPTGSSRTLSPVPKPSNCLSSLPKVIEDAVIVTKNLGLRYLWVDRYCIDQENEVEKRTIIERMHLIYQEASVTIIAAAGEDDSYGLVGVSDISRNAQLSALTAVGMIISTLRHPNLVIRSSKWATRGWTYQEAFFSRRRLVFTEEQVYFECRSMNCQESIHLALQPFHTKDKSQLKSFLRTGLFDGADESQHFRELKDVSFEYVLLRKSQYMTHVENYTARNLTKAEDSLNAFMGVIHQFVEGKGKDHVLSLSGRNTEEGNENLLSILPSIGGGAIFTWSHVQAHCPAVRRDQFPSWTWAGWEGQVRFPLKPDYFTHTFGDQGFQLHLNNTMLCPVTDYRLQVESRQNLEIRGRTIPSSEFHKSTVSGGTLMLQNFRLTPFISDGPRGLDVILSEIKSGKWMCIKLCAAERRMTFGEMVLKSFLLVVEGVKIEKVIDACRRIGTIEVEDMGKDELVALPWEMTVKLWLL